MSFNKKVCQICKNGEMRNFGTFLHPIPRSKELRAQWLAVLHLPPEGNISDIRVCSHHFNIADFTLLHEPYLKADAVPLSTPAICRPSTLPNFYRDDRQIRVFAAHPPPVIDPEIIQISSSSSDTVSAGKESESRVVTSSTPRWPQNPAPPDDAQCLDYDGDTSSPVSSMVDTVTPIPREPNSEATSHPDTTSTSEESLRPKSSHSTKRRQYWSSNSSRSRSRSRSRSTPCRRSFNSADPESDNDEWSRDRRYRHNHSFNSRCRTSQNEKRHPPQRNIHCRYSRTRSRRHEN